MNAAYEMLKSWIKDFADEPCEYKDNCPLFVKLNHYECTNCSAKRILKKAEDKLNEK